MQESLVVAALVSLTEPHPLRPRPIDLFIKKSKLLSPGAPGAVPSVVVEASQSDISSRDDRSAPNKGLKPPAAQNEGSDRMPPAVRRRSLKSKACQPQYGRSGDRDFRPQITPVESDTANDHGEIKLVLQLETRPISEDQLVAEVNGNYAGLVMSGPTEAGLEICNGGSEPNTHNTRLTPINAAFVKAHGILFNGRSADQFDSTMEEFVSKLDSHINRMAERWIEAG
ncbi:hypothetical protein DL771_009727 [Monosporascus sp. 5C6A]|nr:hypothetical protein DL771_009727 [Monosporascus sp. 5C6A]